MPAEDSGGFLGMGMLIPNGPWETGNKGVRGKDANFNPYFRGVACRSMREPN
jgi:hypothetical protein